MYSISVVTEAGIVLVDLKVHGLHEKTGSVTLERMICEALENARFASCDDCEEWYKENALAETPGVPELLCEKCLKKRLTGND